MEAPEKLRPIIEMSVKIQTKYGAHIITVEGKNLEEAIELLGPIAEFPRTGPNGEEDIMFRHRHTAGYDFFEIVNSDGKTFSLGQRKEGGLFPKHDRGWERYEGGNRDARPDDRTVSVPKSTIVHEDTEDDIPF